MNMPAVTARQRHAQCIIHKVFRVKAVSVSAQPALLKSAVTSQSLCPQSSDVSSSSSAHLLFCGRTSGTPAPCCPWPVAGSWWPAGAPLSGSCNVTWNSGKDSVSGILVADTSDHTVLRNRGVTRGSRGHNAPGADLLVGPEKSQQCQ